MTFLFKVAELQGPENTN